MIQPITKILLALGCAGTLAVTANAQVMTYTQGDFLVGFRQIGSTNSVVADIGPITNFTSPLSFTINLGATLSAQFGSGWASNANTYFSLVETDSGDNTSYVTSAHYLTGPNAAPAKIWSRLTNSQSNIFQGKVNSFGTEFTSAGTVEPMTDANAYANYMPGGSTDGGHATAGNIAWGYFNPTSEGALDQTTTGVVLDLIKLAPGSGPGSDLGSFQLSANGNTLAFTPAGVPEPSSYVAIAVWGTVALLGYLVNKARKSSTQEQSV